MNLRFIKKYEGEDLRPISFWCEPVKYTFEITCADEEDIDLHEKEFRLNVKNQMEDSYFIRK